MIAWFVVVLCLFLCGDFAALEGVEWLLYACAQGPIVC